MVRVKTALIQTFFCQNNQNKTKNTSVSIIAYLKIENGPTDAKLAEFPGGMLGNPAQEESPS